MDHLRHRRSRRNGRPRPFPSLWRPPPIRCAAVWWGAFPVPAQCQWCLALRLRARSQTDGSAEGSSCRNPADRGTGKCRKSAAPRSLGRAAARRPRARAGVSPVRGFGPQRVAGGDRHRETRRLRWSYASVRCSVLLGAAADRRTCSGVSAPAVYEAREYVEDGGLMSYGPNIPDLSRRAAVFVVKISSRRQSRRLADRAAD